MSKRSQPHLILSPKGEAHRVTSRQWREMVAEGSIKPKTLANGELSRRVAVLSATALLYHSWIAIERAWLINRAVPFSQQLDYFRQQEMVLKMRREAVNEDVATWEAKTISRRIAEQPAPGLLPS